MKLIWHGHSCFSVVTDAGTAVFDPYIDGMVPGLAPLSLTADAVYCSHGHDDHNARDKVALSGRARLASCQAEGIVPFLVIRQKQQHQLAFCYERLMVAELAQLFQYLRVRDAQDGIQLHVAGGRRHHSRC